MQINMFEIVFTKHFDKLVFDRLQRVGICLSYANSLRLVDQIGGHFNDELIDLIREGRRFRIVGDNINWKVDVHDQRLENKDKFHHAFGSAFLVLNIEFDHLSNISPQRDFRTTPVHCFLPSEADMLETKKNYVILISRLHSSFYLTLNNWRPFVKKTSASHAVSN